VFDTVDLAWNELTNSMKGDVPQPRYGHRLISLGNRLFLHGGITLTGQCHVEMSCLAASKCG
jgi:hypothetical protein